jgi:hypothetical protein
MPVRPSVRLGRLLAAGALILSGAGCIHVEGRSSSRMRQDLLDSFLFKSADVFYPEGRLPAPGEYPRLGPSQARDVEKTYVAVLEAVQRAHERHRDRLFATVGHPLGSASRIRARITNTGQANARLESNGDLSVDVRIAQAIYRATLIAGLQDRSLTGAAFMSGETGPRSEDDLLREFLEMKKTVQETHGRTTLGDLTSGADLDSPFSRMTKLSFKSAGIEQHYVSQMYFVMAHEVGHQVLGHIDRLRSGGRLSCEEAREMEAEADAYGILLYALETPQESLPLMGSSSGFDDFFAYAYDLSGFASSAVACDHPDPESRRQFLEQFDRSVRNAQAKAFWNEVYKRASK